MKSFLALLTAFTLVSAAAAQPAPPPAPMVKPEGLRVISSHVRVIPDNSVPGVSNIGFILGANGVLVVDTGMGPPNGAIVAQVAAKFAAGSQIYLVTTHIHPEHDLGAQAFPANIKMIRARAQVTEIQTQGLTVARLFASRSPVMAQLLEGAQFRTADIVFDQTYDLDLGGGVKVQLIALGPNHTAGDTAIWVPGDRVLFSGDVAMRAQPAMMAQGTTVAKWLDSLARLEALAPQIVVPSHGPLGDIGFIRGYRSYLEEVSTRTLAAKSDGLDLAATTTLVSDAMKDRYPDAGRLAGAIRVAYGN
ncbi:MAG: MBL fold metallo-hydrolase [Caulobacteraceae bacterium]